MTATLRLWQQSFLQNAPCAWCGKPSTDIIELHWSMREIGNSGTIFGPVMRTYVCTEHGPELFRSVWERAA